MKRSESIITLACRINPSFKFLFTHLKIVLLLNFVQMFPICLPTAAIRGCICPIKFIADSKFDDDIDGAVNVFICGIVDWSVATLVMDLHDVNFISSRSDMIV